MRVGHGPRRIVADGPDLAVTHVETVHLLAVEGTPAAAAEHSATWWPVSSTARSRSSPFEMASAGPPVWYVAIN